MLVNNAGNFYAGYFENISPAQFRAQMETNFFGPLNVTRAILPVMRKQRSGQVITITSAAGLMGQEFVAAYAASKFALEGWMESLRFDVEPFGIKTMTVEPGFFRTELLVEGSSTIWPELEIEDYAERTAQTIEAWKGMNGLQGGDDGVPAVMRGIGEKLEPLGSPSALPAMPTVLVNPGQPLATPEVFRALAAAPLGADERAPFSVNVPLGADGLVALMRECGNDLERPATALLPVIADIKGALSSQPGCLIAAMSGSGPTCFGIFVDAGSGGASSRRARPL